MSQVLSTVAALIKENVETGVYNLVFRDTDLLNLINSRGAGIKPSTGAAPFQWQVATAANSSAATFTEGQPPPAAGAQTYKRASLNPFYAVASFGKTGHVKDNEAKAGYYAEPSLEGMLTESDVMKKLEDLLCGSTADQGIASIIDSSDTYAGLAPGSVTQWASRETAVGGALTLTVMADMLQGLVQATDSGVSRGASPDSILASPNQIRKYTELAGLAGAANNSLRLMPSQGGPVDLSLNWAMAQYNSIPIFRIRTLATSEMYFVEMSDFELIEHRGLTVKPIVGNAELDAFAVSLGVALKVRRRSRHGKMTGLT